MSKYQREEEREERRVYFEFCSGFTLGTSLLFNYTDYSLEFLLYFQRSFVLSRFPVDYYTFYL